jgi:hypothetical protein
MPPRADVKIGDKVRVRTKDVRHLTSSAKNIIEGLGPTIDGEVIKINQDGDKIMVLGGAKVQRTHPNGGWWFPTEDVEEVLVGVAPPACCVMLGKQTVAIISFWSAAVCGVGLCMLSTLRMLCCGKKKRPNVEGEASRPAHQRRSMELELPALQLELAALSDDESIARLGCSKEALASYKPWKQQQLLRTADIGQDAHWAGCDGSLKPEPRAAVLAWDPDHRGAVAKSLPNEYESREWQELTWQERLDLLRASCDGGPNAAAVDSLDTVIERRRKKLVELAATATAAKPSRAEPTLDPQSELERIQAATARQHQINAERERKERAYAQSEEGKAAAREKKAREAQRAREKLSPEDASYMLAAGFVHPWDVRL